MNQTKRRVACVAAAATLGLGLTAIVAGPASAGTGSYGPAFGCTAYFSNGLDSLGGWARTQVPAGSNCGPLYANFKIYYGGGVYAYPVTLIPLGSGSGIFTASTSSTFIQTRHYYQIPGFSQAYRAVNV